MLKLTTPTGHAYIRSKDIVQSISAPFNKKGVSCRAIGIAGVPPVHVLNVRDNFRELVTGDVLTDMFPAKARVRKSITPRVKASMEVQS